MLGNSLIAVRFFTRIKKEFGVSMPLSTLFQLPTIRQLAVALQEQGAVVADAPATAAGSSASVAKVASRPAAPVPSGGVPPPMLIRPGSGAPPLFLVHDGLGEVLLYRSLALLIDPVHAVYGLEPEQDRGRFLHASIVEMARAKVARIRAVQPTGPYVLAGLCAGGVIAFEIARQLEAEGQRVLFVGLIDSSAVGAAEKTFRIAKGRFDRIREVLRPPAGQSVLKHWIGAVPTIARKAKNFVGYTIGSRLQRRRTARKVEALRVATEEPSTDSQVLQFLELYELAHRQHQHLGQVRGAQVVLFRATASSGDAADTPFREIYADELLGWRELVAGEVLAIDVPGGHSSALQEPNVGVLARELQAGIRVALLRG